MSITHQARMATAARQRNDRRNHDLLNGYLRLHLSASFAREDMMRAWSTERFGQDIEEEIKARNLLVEAGNAALKRF